MIADIPNANGKVTDKNLGDPLVATAPDGLDRQAVLTQRLYSYGETRFYVDGVALGQQFKTEKSARAEVARRIGAGTMGALPLAPRQKAAGQTRVRALSGSDGIVQTAGAGKNTVVELAVREEMRKGRWQVTGYVATKISSYSIESFADSQARTKYGYPLASQTDNTLIRTSTGGAITELAQAHQRTRELVASRSLTKVSAAEAKELSDATRLPKKVVSAMNGSDRIKYLLQETLRQLPESAAGELKAMLTSPESLAVMGAFLVAGAVPFLSVPAMVVGALLLGNDALDTGGKMVDAVKSTLTASTQAELVNAGKDLAQALMHSAVIVASPVAGKRAGQAINTSWKASTSAEGVAANHFKRTVALRNKGQSTDKDVARAAGLLVQAKRATAAGSTPKSTPATPPLQTTTAPDPTTAPPKKSTNQPPTRQTTPDPAAARAAAARSAIEAQLKTKGTGERDLVNLTSSPQARLSAMKSALVERWQGSSGREPLLDGKSQRNLRKAIDSQLARIPGDLAKEQYLKNLAASGQTVARMAKGEPVAGNAVGKGKKQETTVSKTPVTAYTPRRAGESTNQFLARSGVKRTLTSEQQWHADNTGMRWSNTTKGGESADGSRPQVPPSEGQVFKANSAALQRGLAAVKGSALRDGALQADSKLLSSLGRDELAKLRTRLAPRGVELAEGVPQTDASFKALAKLDTAALTGPLLRTVGFDFNTNPLLESNPALKKAARGYAIRNLAAGQDPTRVVEDLKSLFVGKVNKKTGAVISPAFWTKLEAAQALPRGTAAGAARLSVKRWTMRWPPTSNLPNKAACHRPKRQSGSPGCGAIPIPRLHNGWRPRGPRRHGAVCSSTWCTTSSLGLTRFHPPGVD